MAADPNIANQIYSTALSQGVPPAIALAVAQQESGVAQWTPNGNLVTGSAGEIGVFQLMPTTAQDLGVDPTDPAQNIQGGISFLAQLYQKYGDWASALSAYNSGSPTGSPTYAQSVLNIAQNYGLITTPGASLIDDSGDYEDESSNFSLSDPSTVILIGVAALAAGLIWWES